MFIRNTIIASGKYSSSTHGMQLAILVKAMMSINWDQIWTTLFWLWYHNLINNLPRACGEISKKGSNL